MKSNKKFDLNLYALCGFLSTDYYTKNKPSELFRETLKKFVKEDPILLDKFKFDADIAAAAVINVCNEIIFFITDKTCPPLGYEVIKGKPETLKLLYAFYIHIKYTRKDMRQRLYVLRAKLEGIAAAHDPDAYPDNPYSKIADLFETLDVVNEPSFESSENAAKEPVAETSDVPPKAKRKVLIKNGARKAKRKVLGKSVGTSAFERCVDYKDLKKFNALSVKGLIELGEDILGNDHPLLDDLHSYALDQGDDHLSEADKTESASTLSAVVRSLIKSDAVAEHDTSLLEFVSPLTKEAVTLMHKLYKTGLLDDGALLKMDPASTADNVPCLSFTLEVSKDKSIWINLLAAKNSGSLHYYLQTASLNLKSSFLTQPMPVRLIAYKNIKDRDLFYAFLRTIRNYLVGQNIKTADNEKITHLMDVLCDNNLLQKKPVEVIMYV